MAPPLTLVRSSGMPSSFAHANTTGANASFTSNRSMSSALRPLFCNAFAVDGIGPVSMVTGSTPASAKVWKRARGFMLSFAAISSVMISIAAAPSVICDEFPAVMRPSGLNAGFSLPRLSMLDSRRIPSSAVIRLPSASRTGIISF